MSLLLSALRKRRFEVSMIILWLLVVLLNAILARGYTGWSHVMLTVTLGMIIIMQVAYAELKRKAFNTIVFWTIILLGIEALRSLPMLFSNPGIARELMEKPDVLFLYETFSSGVGDYNLYTANAIVLPFFIAVAFGLKRIKRIIVSISCVFIGLAVLLSTFTGAVSIMMFGIIALALMSYGKSLKKFLTGSTLVALFVTVFVVFMAFLGDTEQVSKVIFKIIRLYEGVSEYGFLMGDETKRAYLFMLSFDTFLSNPFWGIGPCTLADNSCLYTYIGGHSSWIDQLAEYGILGFGAFIAFALALALRVFRYLFQYKNSLIIKAVFISGILYFIGGIVNPVLFIPSIMALFYYLVLGSIEIEVNNAIIQQ